VPATQIIVVVAIIGYIILRQVLGEPLQAKHVLLLPLVLTVVGFADLHVTGGHLQSADITCLVIGAVGSALVGCGFGGVMRLESRDGYLWARLPLYGLWLWMLLVVWRLGMIALAGSMHAHIAASTSTLLFSLGINRLAQGAVIMARATTMGVPFAPEPGRDGGLLSDVRHGGGARIGDLRDRDVERIERAADLLRERHGRGRILDRHDRRRGGLLHGLLDDALNDDRGRDRDRYQRDHYDRDLDDDGYERERERDRDRDDDRDRYARDGYGRDRDRYDRDRYDRRDRS